MAVQLVKHRFTVEEYHRLGEAGILAADARVELIDGEIVEMTPIGSPHAGTTTVLRVNLSRDLGDRALVREQNPVTLSPQSEPQPDLAIVHPRPDHYRRAHPRPDEIFFLVEVSDTTGEYDRTVKLPLYARAGIAEVWIVDLAGQCVETYHGPRPDAYERTHRFARSESVSPQAFPALRLAVDEILG
jgi:Uma2 family endonuclease